MCYFRKFHKVVRCDLPENSFFFAEVSYFEQIRMLEGDLAESIGRAIWFRASHFGTDQLLFTQNGSHRGRIRINVTKYHHTSDCSHSLRWHSIRELRIDQPEQHMRRHALTRFGFVKWELGALAGSTMSEIIGLSIYRISSKESTITLDICTPRPTKIIHNLSARAISYLEF